MLQINKRKPKDHNVDLVGLGNTRILIDYAQKSLVEIPRIIDLPSTKKKKL